MDELERLRQEAEEEIQILEDYMLEMRPIKAYMEGELHILYWLTARIAELKGE